MTDRRLRVAGWGSAADGTTVTWSVAEGRRGRRYREVLSRDGAVVHALLLETTPDRRFAHLELAREGVLVTAHPEPDGTIHGNTIAADGSGVRHLIGLATGPEGLVMVDGSVMAAAAIAWQLRDIVEAGGRATFEGVSIDSRGHVEIDEALSVERLSPTRWRIAHAPAVDVGEDGRPILADGATLPLELD